MDGWVDRGGRHQDPSLIVKSKGAARGRTEMFDHRLKVYRNADPGASPPLPSSFCLVALSMSFWVLPILAWYPLVAHGTAITSASDQSAARLDLAPRHSIAVKQIANRRTDTFC